MEDNAVCERRDEVGTAGQTAGQETVGTGTRRLTAGS